MALGSRGGFDRVGAASTSVMLAVCGPNAFTLPASESTVLGVVLRCQCTGPVIIVLGLLYGCVFCANLQAAVLKPAAAQLACQCTVEFLC